MRGSGVLLPVFSLPGKYGIGSFSEEAYQFVDFLVRAGQSYWQILPMSPTGYGDSPYAAFSTFAGNPYYISLEQLVEQGLLQEAEAASFDFGNNEAAVDYGKIYRNRFALLRLAYARFPKEDPEFARFLEENREWLTDYARFMAAKDLHGGTPFFEWEAELRDRDPAALAQLDAEQAEEIRFYGFLQYLFEKQWLALKAYANKKGIRIIGDIPIYVAADSADVWSAPELFVLGEDRQPALMAGCPPDVFSETGQIWGNPVYDWDAHRKTGYAWWIRRMKRCMEWYDIIRIDHFRGFDEFFAIPAGSRTAAAGEWKKGAGEALFDALRQELGEVPVIAEDLGFVTDSVRRLLRHTGYPGMKILEWAFFVDGGEAQEKSFLPCHFEKNCVVYPGTHDNETLLGWLHSAGEASRHAIEQYIGLPEGTSERKLAEGVIRLANASVADLCIIQMQDYLYLGNEARTNDPGEKEGNWVWRMRRSALDPKLSDWMLQMARVYERVQCA